MRFNCLETKTKVSRHLQIKVSNTICISMNFIKRKPLRNLFGKFDENNLWLSSKLCKKETMLVFLRKNMRQNWLEAKKERI